MDKAIPSPELIHKIAQVFQIPVRELLQNDDERMELVSRIKLVEVLVETQQVAEAEQILHSLEKHQELSDTDRIKIRVHLAECKYQQRKYDESLDLMNPLISSLENVNHPDAYLLAWIRNKIGKSYYKKSDFIPAFYNYQKAYDLISRFPEFDLLAARISYNVGMTLRRKGLDTSSIPFLDRARTFFEENGNNWDLAHSFFEQGKAFKNLKEYDKACECFDRAKAIFQLLNTQKWYNEVQITSASSITLLEHPDLAVDQLKQTLVFMSAQQDLTGIVFVHSKIASILLSLNQSQEGLLHLQQAHQLIETHKLHHTLEAAECYFGFAKYYFHIKEFELCIKSALLSSDIFGTINMLRDQASSIKIAVDAYQSIGELQQALVFERKRSELLEQLSKE